MWKITEASTNLSSFSFQGLYIVVFSLNTLVPILGPVGLLHSLGTHSLSPFALISFPPYNIPHGSY